MVAALAGRRIDPPNAGTKRFPSDNVDVVRARIYTLLGQHTSALVCSAACGADLMALEEAGRIGIRRRVVLPFAPEKFRQTSVVDRPGDWGELFDAIIAEQMRTSDLVVLDYDPADSRAYAATNDAIFEEAERMSAALGEEVGAVVVWDGRSRGADDTTAAFRDSARRKGYPITEILTIRDKG